MQIGTTKAYMDQTRSKQGEKIKQFRIDQQFAKNYVKILGNNNMCKLNIKEHVEDLMSQIKSNKNKGKQQIRLQHKQVRQNKIQDNIQRKRLYDSDIINRKKFQKCVNIPPLFDNKRNIFIPAEGAIGGQERYNLILPERSKNPKRLYHVPKTLSDTLNCRSFQKKKKNRIEYWKEVNLDMEEKRYEELIKSQMGQYRKIRIESIQQPRPFNPPDTRRMNSVADLENSMHSLGEVSKLYFDEKTRNKILKQLEDSTYTPYNRQVNSNYKNTQKKNNYQNNNNAASSQLSGSIHIENQYGSFLPPIQQQKMDSIKQTSNVWKPIKKNHQYFENDVAKKNKDYLSRGSSNILNTSIDLSSNLENEQIQVYF